MLMLILYGDDFIFTNNNIEVFESFKQSTKKEFDMSYLARMRHFLGVEVCQTNHGIFICQ